MYKTHDCISGTIPTFRILKLLNVLVLFLGGICSSQLYNLIIYNLLKRYMTINTQKTLSYFYLLFIYLLILCSIFPHSSAWFECHCAAQATPALGNLPTPADWVHYHFPCIGLFSERAVLSY